MRPSLAQTFASTGNGGRFTVVVNHLKSKGSPCADIGDHDVGDGQGNCNGTRTAAVLALIDWLGTDPTRSMDPDFLFIGDMNAYLAEDPVAAMERAGYANLLAEAFGPDAYSFVFAGQAGALDHALATQSLSSQVAGIAEWHINADEPPILDYNLEFGRDAGLFDAANPFRASDHDPVIVGLDLE
jgi:predicted extracellular nuclease